MSTDIKRALLAVASANRTAAPTSRTSMSEEAWRALVAKKLARLPEAGPLPHVPVGEWKGGK